MHNNSILTLKRQWHLILSTYLPGVGMATESNPKGAGPEEGGATPYEGALGAEGADAYGGGAW